MKTVPFSAILAESCQLIGLDRNTLNDKSFAAIRDFTNRRLSMIWDREDWPDIQQVVQVWPGIPITNVESTVAIATESGVDILQENGETILSEGEDVMIDVTITLNTNYPRIYLRDFAEQAWQKGTIGQTEIHIINPFFVIKNDGSLVAADFSKYNFTYTTADDATDPYITSVTFNVPWCLPQWTPISGSTLQFVKNPQPITVVSGQAIGCWGGDPRRTSRMSNESFIVENMPDIDLSVSSTVQTFSQDLFVLRFANFGAKFVLLRANAPFLFGTRYDAALAYSTGSQVYYDPRQASSAYNPPNKNLQVAGNFWNAIAPAAINIAPANPSFSWSLMAIPFRFKGYLVNSVAADFMRSEGRPTEADSLEAMAEFAVQQQIDVLIRQQGQIQRMNMVYTY
jgi:hypothetical protein